MKVQPLDVSVVIPTCNRASLVADAIQSVLDQSLPGREVIVIDDGSTDDTESVVGAIDSPSVRYVHKQHAGPAAARNLGVREAHGEFLAFLDDDDLWPPDKTERQWAALGESAELDAVLGHTQRFLLREITPGIERFEAYRDPVRLYSLGCGLFRRSVFDRIGLLDENMQHSEDDDWFMRARSLNVNMRFLPEVTLYYRFHGSNMSMDKEAKRPDMLRLLKNRLDRIRSGEEGA